jgi:hypothetical protein
MVEASDPIVRSTLQAAVLAGISNLVAQYLASSRDGVSFYPPNLMNSRPMAESHEAKFNQD